MSKIGTDLIASLSDALAHARGEASGIVAHTVEVPDVRSIRRSLRMSQQQFAEAYHIPISTLRNWEQGRRNPDAPAAAYLRVIARRPRETIEALSL